MFESAGLRRLAALLFSLASTQALAQNTGPQALDGAFGNAGFAPIPLYSGATDGPIPLGFVHLPLAGFHLMFSVQTIGGLPKIVGNKFYDTGVVDALWGTGGSQFYSLPVPDGIGSLNDNDVRVAVGTESGAEIVYLVYRLASDPGYFGIARFRPDGSLIDFSASNLHTLFAGGVAMVKGVATSHDGDDFGGIVVAVQGGNAEVDKSALVPVHGGMILEGNSSAFTQPGLRINRIAPDGAGLVDVVGTEMGLAMYRQIVRLAIETTPARILGMDSMAGAGATNYLVLPARKFGSYEAFPWLTGATYDPGTGSWGMGRVAVDRIFAGDFGD